MQLLIDMLGREIPGDAGLKRVIEASCQTFEAEPAALQGFWERLGLYAGDFALTVYRASVSPPPATFEDRCSAFLGAAYRLHYGAPPSPWDEEHLELVGDFEHYDEPFDCTGSPIGPVLWSLCRFDRLCWDWKDVNVRLGVETADADRELGGSMRAEDGSTFLARVFGQIQGSAGIEEIEAQRTLAQADLARLPNPVQGVSKERFSALIDEDLDRLALLCEGGGCVSSCLVADPSAKIERAFVAYSSGNQKRACVQTSDDWFGVDFATS